MAPREPLPRGPINYAEEQTAQLIGEVKETNRLLGLLLALMERVLPEPAAVGSTLAALVEPTADAASDDTATLTEPPDAEASAEEGAPAQTDPPGLPPPDREVNRHDGPGTAPAKRPGQRR